MTDKMISGAIHVGDCKLTGLSQEPQCGGTYECVRCDRSFGWCIGAADGTPSLCDECAVEIQEGWAS